LGDRCLHLLQTLTVAQPLLVQDLADFLSPSGFLQSDVQEVVIEMRDRFSVHPSFHLHSPDWLAENPLPVSTEREISVLSKGEPVYRALLIRQ
jgi:tRNA (guanine-N7-)-methyltransferase